MLRELFASVTVGPGLVVRESQVAGQAPSLTFEPTSDTYGRLARAEVEALHESLGRWLER